MTGTGVGKLTAQERSVRRAWFISLRAKFKKERPLEKWVRLVAKHERVSEKLVYEIVRGAR